MTASPLLRRARRHIRRRPAAAPSERAQRKAAPRGRAINLPLCRPVEGRAPGWRYFPLDFAGRTRSDEPRIPADQVHRLFPGGAPASWALLVEEPKRPHWLTRLLIGLVSLALGLATFIFTTFAGIVASVIAAAVEVLSIAAHVIGLIGADGSLGVVGRTIAVAAFVATLTRLAWRISQRRSPEAEGRS